MQVAPSANATRREFLAHLGNTVTALAAGAIALPLIGGPLGAQVAPGAATPMTVYKDPGCGCCKEWVKIMTKAGFAVTARDTVDMNTVKSSMGVPDNLQSCHTALVGNYVFEGHVPPDVVLKFLAEKLPAHGLAVPGMPAGSPGMEGPTKDRYNVILFERSGKTRVYASR
ncbi:MAG: DUF411 domain-containing protein [Candidatus Eremiobacteraeota bacterium]|nr:DUF411 domain-containing protein [Candidatus Eremiobacteraeota bacterium]